MQFAFERSRTMAKSLPSIALIAGALLFCVENSGCMFVAPRSQLVALESQNRLLSEQTRAQVSEIENLKTHSRVLEDKVMQAEEQLASLDGQWRADRKRLLAIEG